MISSVGGQNGSPFVGPYSASKFAMEGYSQSLRRELMLYGIDVIVDRPRRDRDADLGQSRRRRSDPLQQHRLTAPMLKGVEDYMLAQGREGLPASDVGDLVWFCFTDPKPKTRYRILRNEFMDRDVAELLGPRAVDQHHRQAPGLPERPNDRAWCSPARARAGWRFWRRSGSRLTQ